MTADQRKFAPIDGIPPEALFEADPGSNCLIASAGTGPEIGWRFLYHDNKYHLYFYTNIMWDEKEGFDVLVKGFTSSRRGGDIPIIHSRDLEGMRQNLMKFFQERDWLDSKRPRDPRATFKTLTFDLMPGYKRAIF